MMQSRLPDPALRGLYAITDSRLLASDRQLLEACEQALEAGIALLQYRDKSQDGVRRRRQGDALAGLCERYATPLIVNDDLELAERLQQRWGQRIGLHIGQDDVALETARARLGFEAIIGATCHGSFSLAQQAAQSGASYLAFGRFFTSRTKPAAVPASLGVLAQATSLGLPRVAIGGIDHETAGEARAAGAELLAMVHAIFGASDIPRAVRELNARVIDPVF